MCKSGVLVSLMRPFCLKFVKLLCFFFVLIAHLFGDHHIAKILLLQDFFCQLCLIISSQLGRLTFLIA
jgi:hypothetical protein